MNLRYRRRLFLAVFSLLMMGHSPQKAEAQESNWNLALGLQGGPAFFVQNFGDDLKGQTGPLLEGHFVYNTPGFPYPIGVALEWEKHRLLANAGGETLGDMTTISLIPFFEVRLAQSGPLSIYDRFGAGINFNSFNASGNVGRDIVKPQDSVALQFALGGDYFLSRSFALNSEIGFKANVGRMGGGTAGAVTIDSGRFRANMLYLFLGARYFIY